MLKDKKLMQAISNILRRSEKQPEVEGLLKTYVEVGVLPQMHNKNNQILLGRRGTGKTHVLRVLGEQENSSVVTYIDLRMLGSAQEFTNLSRPMTQRCTNLFKDFLLEIYNSLLEVVTSTENQGAISTNVHQKLEEFEEAITHVASKHSKAELTKEKATESSNTFGSGINFTPNSLGGQIGQNSARQSSDKITSVVEQVFEDSLIFAQVTRSLEGAIKSSGRDGLFLLINEWPSLPLDIQPYFAEFIKRVFLLSAKSTVKIASLEYRSQFFQQLTNNNVLGFELGSDIFVDLELDDYFVYDRNPEEVTKTFEELLYKHIDNGVSGNFLASELDISTSKELKRRLFTSRNAFVELVRAAEGVARDFINIFTAAYFDAHRKGQENIGIPDIRNAAKTWYEKDKESNLQNCQQQFLHSVVGSVIRGKKARSFLLQRDQARNALIRSLFDYRVLHLMQKGYSDPSNPGIRYDIYTLDYGTYVDLINTQSQPDLGLELQVDNQDHDRVVPFDDKRSIRSIILPRELLERFDNCIGS